MKMFLLGTFAALCILAEPVLADSGPVIECPGTQWATSTYQMELASGWRLLMHPKDAYAEVQAGRKSLLVCNYDNGARAVFEVPKRCRSVTQRGMAIVAESKGEGRSKTSCRPHRDKVGIADFDCAFECE
jgi:hypothetical protein